MKVQSRSNVRIAVIAPARYFALALIGLALLTNVLSITLANAGPNTEVINYEIGTNSMLITLPVELGFADSYGVLAGQGVTNTGLTVVNGDLGTWPNPAITGFGGPPDGIEQSMPATALHSRRSPI